MPRWPVTPEIDEMLTIDPPPAFCITGIANFMPRKTPVALTAIRRCQAAVSNRSSTALPLIPASLPRMSSLPTAARVAAIAACHSASLVTSSFWKIAAPFARVISPTRVRPSASSMSATATLAPSPANTRAMLAPIPEAPPVISATLPSSLMVPPCGSIDPDRGAEGIANPLVDHQIGEFVEPGRLAVDDRQHGAAALGELGERGGRIDHQRRAEHDEEIGGQRGDFSAAHFGLRHRLTERDRRGLDEPVTAVAARRLAVTLKGDPNIGELKPRRAIEAGGVGGIAVQFDDLLRGDPGCLVQPVDILGDDGVDLAAAHQRIDGTMAAIGLGRAKLVFHRKAAAPGLAPCRLGGEEIVEINGRHPCPDAARAAEIRDPRLGADPRA